MVPDTWEIELDDLMQGLVLLSVLIQPAILIGRHPYFLLK